MKSSFILQKGKNEVITTGTFTRVYYLRINDYTLLAIEISGYLECHWFLTITILYNHMIIIVIIIDTSHYTSIDKLTTHESFSSVSDPV